MHLLLFILMAVAPAFALAWFAALHGARAAVEERARSMVDTARLLAATADTTQDPLALFEPLRADRHWWFAIADRQDGSLRGDDALVAVLSQSADLLPGVEAGMAGGIRSARLSAADGTVWQLLIAALPSRGGIAIVGLPAGGVAGAALESGVVAMLLSGGGVLFGISLLLAVYASRRLGGPLAAVEREARAFARGEAPSPLQGSGVMEVDFLAETLAHATAERRAREEERMRLAERLELVLANTSDAVLALDDAGCILYLNAQAAAMVPAGRKPLGTQAAALWPAGPLPSLIAGAIESGGRHVSTGFDTDLGRWIAAEAVRASEGTIVFFHDVTQARALEDALRQGQAQLQAILDHLPVGVLLIGADGRVTFVNQHASELLGGAPEPGTVLRLDEEPPLLQAAVRDRLPARGETRVRRPSGEVAFLRFAAAPLPAPSLGQEATVVAITDLSEERRAAEALRESELRFRTLAEAVPQIVWSASADGQVDYVNPRFAEFTGMTSTDEAEPGGPATHPSDRDAVREAWARSLTAGETFVAEYRLRGLNGEWRWFSAQALPARDPSGRIMRWIGAATDVTDLIAARVALENQVAAEAAARQAAVAAAEALAASEERFRRFAEASPDVLWIADLTGRRFDYVSPAFELIWGVSRKDLAEHPELWSGSIHPEDRERVMAIRREIAAKPLLPLDCEYRILRPDGQERWIHEIGFPVLDAAGRLARRGGFARDVTAAKQAEARQSLLIGELNHRVKNTLATVQSLALQTARGLATPSDPLRRFLAEFQARLLALSRAHDILTARTWSGAMLDEVVRAALAPWQASPPAGKGRIEVAGPPVWLPPRAVLGLSLAIHEMATNAAKYGALSVPQGRVRLSWTLGPEQEVSLSWIERGGPPPRVSDHHGFGTRLLRKGLPGELGEGSTVAIHYPPEGFEAEIRFRAGLAPAAGAP
ncbi:MAG: PAS domain S-box protein [Elioraea tepidiphila]